MRRQRRLDIQVAEERKDLLVGVSLFLETVDRFEDGFRPGLFRRSGTGPIPVDADDFFLLRLIYQMEERGVGAKQPKNVLLAELRNAVLCLYTGRRVILRHRLFAEHPQFFHQVEGALPRLLAYSLPEKHAKEVDLPAQRARYTRTLCFDVKPRKLHGVSAS